MSGDINHWRTLRSECDSDLHQFFADANPRCPAHVLKALQIFEDYSADVFVIDGYRANATVNENHELDCWRESVEQRHEAATRFVLMAAQFYQLAAGDIALMEQWARAVIHGLEKEKLNLPFGCGGLSKFTMKWFDSASTAYPQFTVATSMYLPTLLRGLAAIQEMKSLADMAVLDEAAGATKDGDEGVDDEDVNMSPKDTVKLYKHSDDFISVTWAGKQYSFSRGHQADSVRRLWEAMDNRTPALHEKDIAIAIDADNGNFRLNHVFRKKASGGGYQNHPAWGTMIQKADGKGTYQLAPKK